jgi:hypothetical protein
MKIFPAILAVPSLGLTLGDNAGGQPSLVVNGVNYK